MDYYLVTISIANEKFENFESFNWVCSNLKTAIKCAKHKAFVYNFEPLNDDKLEGVSDNHLFKSYNKGYISIRKYHMWEKESD